MMAYVATAFGNWRNARSFMDRVENETQFCISQDWTQQATMKTEGVEELARLRSEERNDRDGITNSTALVVLDHQDAESTWTELGFALISGISCVVVSVRPANRWNLFMHNPNCIVVSNDDQAIQALRFLAALR